MKDKVALSVVVITKNEESRLRECLESVKWAKEIIIVDDFSTDRTLDIAREYTDKIFQKKMEIEGAHRNWAYSKAKNGWVFSVDADERPTEELRTEIKEVISNTEHNYFDIPFRTYIGNYWIHWGGWYPASKVKLFRKDKFKYEEVEVHPRIIADGTCGHLKGDVIHYGYRNWGDFLNKTNRQTTLEAIKWHKLFLKNPKKARCKMNLIHALWRTLDRFIRAFFAKKGYRDGFVGFMIAYFSSLYQIVSYAKYRELIKNGDKNV